ERPLIVDGRGHVKVVVLLAVRIADDVADGACVVALRSILRVPHDLVDEVAEMKDECQAVCGSATLVLPDHAAIGVARAELNVLTADERELHWPSVGRDRRGERATDAAAEPVFVGEAV